MNQSYPIPKTVSPIFEIHKLRYGKDDWSFLKKDVKFLSLGEIFDILILGAKIIKACWAIYLSDNQDSVRFKPQVYKLSKIPDPDIIKFKDINL